MPLNPHRLNGFLLVSMLAIGGCGVSEDQLSGDFNLSRADESNSLVDQSRSIIDLRADVNRNGIVELDSESEDQDEDTWEANHGAVFLANLDDDEQKCPNDPTKVSDIEFAKCNDAANEVIDGPDDLFDLAPLKVKPWPKAPDTAQGQLIISTSGAAYVRLFKKQVDGSFQVFRPSSDNLSVDDLRQGVDFALEGKDIIRDKDKWNGMVDITLRVDSDAGMIGQDTVRFRLSPIMTSHHLLPAETIYATKIDDGPATLFRADLQKAVEAAGVPQGLVELDVPFEFSDGQINVDQWTQDYFETGYMSMPATNGQQHVIRVVYRSANLSGTSKANPLRIGGKVVFSYFHGKDVAGIQEYNIQHDSEMDTLDSFGNTETIPPYAFKGTTYPLGRLFRGKANDFFPDTNMSKLLESQGLQPPVYIDTSWLLVGHVDETLSFVKADNSRGWTILANDARLAKAMLEEQVKQGNGQTKMFIGKYLSVPVDDEGNQWKDILAETTIQKVLNDPDIMNASAEAAVKVDAQLQTLKEEIGIADEEIVRIPFLHMDIFGLSLAYQPATVNGTYLSDTDFAAPDPHGPVVKGKDIFKAQMEEALGALGITVHWVEDWDYYHAAMGEVHCGSNAMRQIPQVKWWEVAL